MSRKLKEHYSVEEATRLINKLLSRYGETVRITFREYDAEIIDSYLVRGRNMRQLVCRIITRTGVTGRSYRDLSAEWQVHNVSYYAGYKTEHAKDVSLDYAKDPRLSVRVATILFDKLHLD